MGTEIELKLALPPQALRQAQRLAWLRKLATRYSRPRRLTSVYFDTDRLKLQKQDVTLRVRRDGSKWIQTIKRGPTKRAAPLERGEWEAELKSGRPDLKQARGTPLAPLINKRLTKGLRPVFRTEVQRRLINIRLNGSDIEVAFDHGKVVAGRHDEPICEIELELKQGRIHDLAALARRLSRTLPLAFGPQAKSDRGYALKLGKDHGPVRGKDIVLDPAQPAGEAFRQIGLSCLQHMAANQRAVEAGDGEGIHQMRVGLRRLRAAISLFGPVVVGEETERIKTELKWLTEQLGPARDLDVLVEEAVAPLRAANPDQPELEVLEREVKHELHGEVERARAAVRCERYRHVVMATALWLLDGAWSRATRNRGRDRAIVSPAAEILDRRTKKVAKRASYLPTLDASGRHRLRIAIKKLRYATEFFGSLFDHPKLKKQFTTILTDLQDSLGKLNDMAVHASRAHHLAGSHGRSPQLLKRAYAMGFLTGREKGEARALERAAERAGKKLSNIDPFW